MKQRSITASEANVLLTELRAMALLPPGQDADALARARDICSLLQAQQHGGRTGRLGNVFSLASVTK